MHWVRYIRRESVVAMLFQDDFEVAESAFERPFCENCDKRAYQVWFSDILYLGQTDSSFLLRFFQFKNHCSLV